MGGRLFLMVMMVMMVTLAAARRANLFVAVLVGRFKLNRNVGNRKLAEAFPCEVLYFVRLAVGYDMHRRGSILAVDAPNVEMVNSVNPRQP